VRWQIALLIAVVSAVTYIDRLNFAIAGSAIQTEFHFSTATMGWLLSAFVLGYALFQIPNGWLADRLGGRRMMTFAVIWWSAFTAATALAPRWHLVGWFSIAWAFGVVRFLVGVGEAAAWPTASRMVGLWLGEDQRGMGSSLNLIGVGASGLMAPLLIAWILGLYGWRPAFLLCAAMGLVLAVVWYVLTRDRPEEHPGVNAAELAEIHAGELASPPAVPSTRVLYRTMLASRSVWGLSLGYFCPGYPIYIFHTWFFIYLVRVRHLSLLRSGVWDSGPYLAILILAPLGGWLSDRASLWLGRTSGRRLAAAAGMIASAVLLWTGAHATSQPLALTLLCCAAGFNMFGAASWWATTIDLLPQATASLAGVMNAFGNLGGWAAPIATGYFAVAFGWTFALDVAALVSLAGAALWFLVDAGQPLTLPDIRSEGLASTPRP